MRRYDKKNIITEANKRLESSYLKSKGFLNEDETAPQPTKGRSDEERLKQSINIDSILKNEKVQKIINSLASDPKKLKKLTDEVISNGISKDVLIQAVKNIKNGQSVDSLLKSELNSIHETISLKEGKPNLSPEMEDNHIDDETPVDDYETKSKKWEKEDDEYYNKMGTLTGALIGVLTDLGLLKTGGITEYWHLLVPVVGGIVAGSIGARWANKTGKELALKDFQKQQREKREKNEE